MSVLESVAPLLTQVVTVEVASTGLDGYGRPAYGDPRTVPARVVGRTRLVRTVAGDERVSTVTVYLGEVTGITPRDRLTLPAPFAPSQPPILAVQRVPDVTGALHEVVLT